MLCTEVIGFWTLKICFFLFCLECSIYLYQPLLIYIYMCVYQVAARRVQVLNSVNSKLPFLVTTADDAKDSLKEEIRLR